MENMGLLFQRKYVDPSGDILFWVSKPRGSDGNSRRLRVLYFIGFKDMTFSEIDGDGYGVKSVLTIHRNTESSEY